MRAVSARKVGGIALCTCCCGEGLEVGDLELLRGKVVVVVLKAAMITARTTTPTDHFIVLEMVV